MTEKRTDKGRNEARDSGSRMLTAEETDDLLRSTRETLAFCKAHFRKNPL